MKRDLRVPLFFSGPTGMVAVWFYCPDSVTQSGQVSPFKRIASFGGLSERRLFFSRSPILRSRVFKRQRRSVSVEASQKTSRCSFDSSLAGQDTANMLPGFRFIVMTLLLGTSVVIFGLGAAALLRATHEGFASMPSLRTLQQQVPATFVERSIPVAPPTLSLLRVEPQAEAVTARPAAKDADVVNLTPVPEVQSIQGKGQTTQPVRKRSSKMKRARSRSAAIHKRRISAQRAARDIYAQMPVRQELFPPLFGN